MAQERHKTVLQRATTTFVSDMEPLPIIDLFFEKQMFTDTVLRDLQEIPTTSDKNRKILQRVATLGPEGYRQFKDCLNASLQSHLTDVLNRIEREIGL